MRIALLLCLSAVVACGTAGPPNPAPAPAGVPPVAVAVGAEPPAMARLQSVHLALGVPTDSDPSDDIVIDHDYFVLSYNAARLDPNWVAWRLVAEDVGNAPRRNRFRSDPKLPGGVRAVTTGDYDAAGYDRGHMCPSADRTSTAEANAATFFMTNMQPQLHALNGGPWARLEDYARGLAKNGQQLFMFAGGIFENPPMMIGPGIAVPSFNYKIVVALDPGKSAAKVQTDTTVFAVIMPNSPAIKGTKWHMHMVTVNEIEQKTGYDFLSAIPDTVEDVVEARMANPP